MAGLQKFLDTNGLKLVPVAAAGCALTGCVAWVGLIVFGGMIAAFSTGNSDVGGVCGLLVIVLVMIFAGITALFGN